MNARHAAALSLVGWYLMVPPSGYPLAELSIWTVKSHFKTEAGCEAERKKSRAEGRAASVHYTEELRRMTPYQQLMDGDVAQHPAVAQIFARCFADNDPRLKSK
jgi:hypothetical protein